MPFLRLKPLVTAIAFGVNSAWIYSWQVPPCFPSGPYPLACCWDLFYVMVVGMVPCIQPGFHSVSYIDDLPCIRLRTLGDMVILGTVYGHPVVLI